VFLGKLRRYQIKNRLLDLLRSQLNLFDPKLFRQEFGKGLFCRKSELDKLLHDGRAAVTSFLLGFAQLVA
jgi:hypothetical protein